ncbi:MAG TPA: acyl-CoA dehydrogenase family protein [Candidatus Nanopelagicaceae bacterium]|nr:acyl-CoA dehydrogenase family protein [Candidatus Nanopelagicaceae bacterium]
MNSALMQLSGEHQDLASTVESFANEVVAPVAALHDREHSFPYEVVRKMADMGLFALPFPEEFGGMGGDYLSLCIAIEELARVDQSVAVTLEAAVSLGSMPIFRAGTRKQKDEFLRPLISGQALGGFGLTEPDAGSDASRLRTTARLVDNEWVINGAKTFITNSGTSITSLVTVACVTGERSRDVKELSAIIVPAGTTGFVVDPPYYKVGWHASDTHPLTFIDVHVSEDNLLGERGRGYANFLRTLDEGRVAIAALAVGAAQGCIDEAVRYSKERQAFGKLIGEHQGIAFKIAEMQARTHTARLAYYHAAFLIGQGKEFKTEASIAKLVASEAAMENARAATQIFGGYGFMDDFPVARHYRDSKILEIGEGTSEVQKILIARSLGLNAE